MQRVQIRLCKGIGLILVVMSFAILALCFLITPMLQTYDKKEADGYDLTQIRNIAESGIYQAMAGLKSGELLSERPLSEEQKQDLGQGSFVFKVFKANDETWSVASTGYLRQKENLAIRIEAVIVKRGEKLVIRQWSERVEHGKNTK